MWKTDSRCERIRWSGPALGAKVGNSLLAVLAGTTLLRPMCALSAEREGTVLFFSFCRPATGTGPPFPLPARAIIVQLHVARSSRARV
jgi:hypothetical protein